MNRFVTVVSLISITALTLLAGCGDTSQPGTDLNPADVIGDTADTGAVDVMPDQKIDDTSSDAIDVDTVNPDVSPDVTPFDNGATARVITTEAELIKGPIATGTIGDILIKNKYVRFIVRTQEIGLYSPFGGNLVDADLVREEGDEGHEKFLELLPMVGFGRALKPEKIEIIDDGAISGKAVVRVTGIDHGLSVVDMLTPTWPLYLSATMDYALDAESHELEIKVTATNKASYEQEVTIGSFLQFGKRFEKFYHQCGLDKACLTGKSNIEWMAAAAGDVSFAFTTAEGSNPKVVLAQDDILLTEGTSGTVAAGGSVSVTQYLVVGDGTIDSAANRAMELRHTSGLRTVTGKVNLAESVTEYKDVRVYAKDTGSTGKLGWLDASQPDAEGNVTLHLPDGQYDLTVTAPGTDDLTVSDVTVSEAGPNTFTADANGAGMLHVTINDGEGNLLPAGIVLQVGADAPLNQDGLFQAINGGDRRFPVHAGEYTIVAMKGFEYSLASQSVTVTAGETTNVLFSLHHVIDTPNQLTLTAHDHSEYAIDATGNLNDRVHNALACGIEIPMLTDHDYFSNLQPFIEEEGMASLLKSAFGIEISPLGFHTVGLNCKNPGAYPTYFAIPFGGYDDEGMMTSKYTPNQLVDMARNDHQCQYVGVAHPWEGSAMFNYIGMAPGDDPADTADMLDMTKINGLEIINSDNNWSDLTGGYLAGWFTLLNYGYNVWAVGGADQDEYLWEFGYPLNLVEAGTDSAADVVMDDLFDNLNAGHNLVYAGPYVTVDIGGKTYGEVLDLSVIDESPTADIVVQAPEWMRIEFVRVFANGEMIADNVVPERTAGSVTVFTGSIPIDTFTVDTYIVVVAGSASAESRMPGYGRPPLSVTNPVFIDVDGDGWEAPLAK